MEIVMKNEKILKKVFGKYIEMNSFDFKIMLAKKRKKCTSIINQINNDELKDNDILLPLDALETYKAYLFEFMNSNEFSYTIFETYKDNNHYSACLKFTGNEIILIIDENDNLNQYKNQADIVRNVFKIHINKAEKNKVKTI